MKGRVILPLLGLLLLTGCGHGLPQSREMDDMALMRTMGVDGGEGENYLVTVSTARRAQGLRGEGQPPLILSAPSPSIPGACLAIQGLSESYVFYGHVDQLLLGEELAQTGGVREVLDQFGQEEQLGLGAQVWLVRGDTALSAIAAGKETGVDSRLSTLQEDGQLGVSGLCRSAGEVLGDLLEVGCAYLPALAVTEGEDALLLESGYGILKGDGLAGWLTGEDARGLELLEGQPGAALLELEGASVQIYSAVLTCLPVVEGEELTGLSLDLRLLGRVAAGRGADLEGQVEALEQARAERVLKRLQDWNADCLSLGRKAGSACPEHWGTISQQWEEKFPHLQISVRCTAKLTDK